MTRFLLLFLSTESGTPDFSAASRHQIFLGRDKSPRQGRRNRCPLPTALRKTEHTSAFNILPNVHVAKHIKRETKTFVSISNQLQTNPPTIKFFPHKPTVPSSPSNTANSSHKMNSTTSLTSTSSLMPSSFRRAAAKNWESAFGRLSSSYGFGGSSAPSLPRKASKSSASSSASTSSRSPSSLALSEKDYESSFGDLSSTYGFGGAVPTLPSKSVKSSKPSPKVLPPSQVQSTVGHPPKDYEAAFGSLSSTYGFGVVVPSLPRKKSKPSKATAKTVAPQIAPQQQSSVPRPPKNYEDAFGALSSSYGFASGFAPSKS